MTYHYHHDGLTNVYECPGCAAQYIEHHKKIDKIARALSLALHRYDIWHKHSETVRHQFRLQAEAAIEAMK